MSMYPGPPVFDPRGPTPCQDDPELFVGLSPYSGRLTDDEVAAIALCQTCPAFDRCRDFGMQHKLANDEIWGGLTGRERRKAAGVKKGEITLEPRLCKRAHDLSEMYERPGRRGRSCRACNRELKRARYEARRELVSAA